MGISVPMQPWITLKGATSSTSEIIQPAKNWLNAQDYKQVAIDVLLLENKATTGYAILELETSIAPEGPWTSLATFGAGYCKAINYFTTDSSATSKFERFIRWKIDQSTGTPTAWEACFRICAVVK